MIRFLTGIALAVFVVAALSAAFSDPVAIDAATVQVEESTSRMVPEADAEAVEDANGSTMQGDLAWAVGAPGGDYLVGENGQSWVPPASHAGGTFLLAWSGYAPAGLDLIFRTADGIANREYAPTTPHAIAWEPADPRLDGVTEFWVVAPENAAAADVQWRVDATFAED